jgi:hypothetical protein
MEGAGMGSFFAVTLLASSCIAADPVPGCTPTSYLYQPAFCIDHELRQPAEPYVPQPGDLFLCTGCEMWAKLGHFVAFASAPQHSGIVWARPDGTMALLEGGPRNTLHCNSLDLLDELSFYATHERIWIRRRCIPLTPEQCAALTDFALKTEGKRFGLWRMFAQVTPFRCRGPIRTEFMGKPHGCDHSSYYCAELVMEACVAAGLLDPEDTRPAATFPRDIFYGRSWNPFIDRHLDLSAWCPPARWTLCPGTEPKLSHFKILDGDN